MLKNVILTFKKLKIINCTSDTWTNPEQLDREGERLPDSARLFVTYNHKPHNHYHGRSNGDLTNPACFGRLGEW